MASEIKLWQLSKGKLQKLENESFSANYLEEQLENLIAENSSLLGDDLLVIDRQREIRGVGVFDLLCLDMQGKLVIVELKRDQTPREAVAQALHYASWLDGADESEVLENAEDYLQSTLEVAFEKRFGTRMPEIDPKRHRIILAAPRLDIAAEAIVNYLNERYSVDINAVFFRYARLGDGQEVLARTVLVPDEIRKVRTAARRLPTIAELEAVADQRQAHPIMEICRQASEFLKEETDKAYGK